MTTRSIFLRFKKALNSGSDKRSGVVKMNSLFASSMPCMAAVFSRLLSVLFTSIVSMPTSSSLSAWSFISEISGDTTKVTPGMRTAGS